MATKPTKPGRPAGSPNVRETTLAVLPRCPACQSTESRCCDTRDTRCVTTVAGKPVTNIVRRTMRCPCGQQFVAIAHEYRPEAA